MRFCLTPFAATSTACTVSASDRWRLYGYRISELWNAADLNLVTTVAW